MATFLRDVWNRPLNAVCLLIPCAVIPSASAGAQIAAPASDQVGSQAATDRAASQPGTAPADAPPSDTTVPLDQPSSTGLQEIVVTAQKRSQNLQEVPIAVSAVTSSSLAAANITTAADLGRIVPALNIFSTGGVVQPFLRGIGNPASLTGNEGSVAVYLDDVYVARVPVSLLELNSISRIEVLKGPQGTLFGRNASGGLVHIITRDPSDTPVVEASVGYGNYQTLRANLYASTGLAPGLAIDVSGLLIDQGKGWGRNVALDREWGKKNTKAVRSKLHWDATPTTTVTVTGDYSHSTDDFLAHSQYLYGPSRGYSLPPYGLQPRLGFYDIEANTAPLNRDRNWGVSARIDQKLSFATLTSITAYRHDRNLNVFDADFSKQNFLNASLYGFTKQLSQEFQLASRSRTKFEWLLGLYYLDLDAGFSPSRFTGQSVDAAAPLLGLPAGTQIASDTYGESKNRSYAGYGQATYHVTSRLGLTLGARYTKDKLRGYGRSDLYPIGSAPFTLGVSSGHQNFDKFTYKASLDYKITPDALVYLSQSRGYKAGVYNTLPFSNPAAQPEVLDSTEVGFKSELFDRRIRLNGAAFYYRFSDAQFQQFNGPTVLYVNAKRARLYGAELEGEAVVAHGLNLRFGAAYLNSKYRDFTNAQTPVPNTNTNPALGPVGGYLDALAPYDASGNSLIRVPKWTANVGVNYTVQSSAGDFNVDVNYAFNDSFAWDADNVLRQPSYNILGAQIKYTFPGQDRFAVRLWAKNLTGAHYYVAEIQSAGARGSSAMPGAPRTFGFDWLLKI